jgi:hypothetical protein
MPQVANWRARARPGPDVVAVSLGGVPEAETNAGARHADVGDAPLIFEVPHAAAWVAN